MAYHSFEELDVWKNACRLTVDVHAQFKESKDYFMRDQILRSALSVPSNIAEGCERGSEADTNRFLHIAKGSCAELRTQLYLSVKMGLVSAAAIEPLIAESKSISAQLHNLIASLKRRQQKS